MKGVMMMRISIAVLALMMMAASAPMSAGGSEFETRYFLAGPWPRLADGDGYVVPVRNAEDLARVMENLAEPIETRDRVTTTIASGPDWINRDYLHAGSRLWHWHVTEFIGFTEGSSPIHTRLPAQVEEDPENFIRYSGGGYICWPVVRELTLEEIFWVKPTATESGVQLEWMDLGEGHEYTVEISLVGSGVWATAEGDWPTTETLWLDAASETAGGMRVYRVRADRSGTP